MVQVENNTHNETTIHVVYVLLQRCLAQTLAKVGVRRQRTNLILDHRVANVVDKATEPLRVLDVVDETLDHSLINQFLESYSNPFQFPSN